MTRKKKYDKILLGGELKVVKEAYGGQAGYYAIFFGYAKLGAEKKNYSERFEFRMPITESQYDALEKQIIEQKKGITALGQLEVKII